MVGVIAESRTTLLLTNLPRSYTRDMLLGLFNDYGFLGSYDFVYVPMDAKNLNKGQAHINFVNPLGAAQFCDTFNGFSRWWLSWSKEVCEVSWSNEENGLQANIDRHRNTVTKSDLISEPVIFSDGVRIPFPKTSEKTLLPEVEAFEHIPVDEACDAQSERSSSKGSSSGRSDPDMRTTMVLKNLPTCYTREMLLGLFDNHGFVGTYDFIFLPMDFKSSENLGYAYVNFVGPLAAAQFSDYFNGFDQWWRSWGTVTCVVTVSLYEQGYQTNVERYRNSPVMHESVPDAFKPAVFWSGVRQLFPHPTKKIRPPRSRTFPSKGSGASSPSSRGSTASTASTSSPAELSSPISPVALVGFPTVTFVPMKITPVSFGGPERSDHKTHLTFAE